MYKNNIKITTDGKSVVIFLKGEFDMKFMNDFEKLFQNIIESLFKFDY